MTNTATTITPGDIIHRDFIIRTINGETYKYAILTPKGEVWNKCNKVEDAEECIDDFLYNQDNILY